MYLLLTSFFISLFSITFMIGRKLVLLKNGNITELETQEFEFPNLKELRHSTIQNLKKYGKIALIVIIRSYLRSKNFLKNKYQILKIEVKKIHRKRNAEGKTEVSKFLKTMSEYKQKIREIKHQIKEEENL